VDELDTPRDDGRLNIHDESGMTRRDLMKRGAVVGGTLLWVAPAIQSFGSKAFAQENGSPLCEGCIELRFDPNGPNPPPPTTGHVFINATEVCCDCIDAEGGDLNAVIQCAIAGDCTVSSPAVGPCPGE
jgi:hypothetical protein